MCVCSTSVRLDLQARRDDEYLLGILITADKKAVTRHWLPPDPPTIQEWIGQEWMSSIYIFALLYVDLFQFVQSSQIEFI